MIDNVSPLIQTIAEPTEISCSVLQKKIRQKPILEVSSVIRLLMRHLRVFSLRVSQQDTKSYLTALSLPFYLKQWVLILNV